MEGRRLLTINLSVVAGGTLDLNPASSVFPAGDWAYMNVMTPSVPGTSYGTMYKVNGASQTVWGTVTGGTFFAPPTAPGSVSTANRVYGSEGFQYVSKAGTPVGTSESIPVQFSTLNGSTRQSDTLVITTVSSIGAPQITTQPTAATSVVKGGTATLSVTATASNPLTYQWYSGVSPNGYSPISGATGRTFTTPALTTAQQYFYWVKVSAGGLSTASQTATIFVGTPATVNTGGPYTVPENGSVTLNATANSPDTNYLVYDWDFDGDGVYGEQTTAFGDENGANAVFNAAGLDGPSSRNLSLRVTTDKDLSTFATTTVSITNAAPTAMFSIDGVPGAAKSSGVVRFYNVTDSPADVASMKYSYDFNNDGTFDVVNSTSSSVTVPSQYMAGYLAGQPVRGRLTDSSGAVSPDYLTTVNGHVITVTTLSDTVSSNASYAVGTSGISLRDAITLAESNSDPDQILFAPALQSNTLNDIRLTASAATGTAFSIKTAVVITGPATTKGIGLAGQGTNVNYRAFTVSGGGQLTLENLNVHDFGSVGAGATGGAIYSKGQLTIRRSAFYKNGVLDNVNTAGFRGLGGAIAVEGAPALIENSTFANNFTGQTSSSTAGWGGAIAATYGATLTLLNSTVSANTATTAGGVFVLTNTGATTAAISNTIIYGNRGTTAANDYYQYAANAAITSSGTNNLFGSSTGSPTAFGGTYSTANPVLGPLDFNGGPTMNMSISLTSPAYNSGAVLSGITTDQRGLARAVGTPDIGAYEAQISVTQNPVSQTVFPGKAVTFTAAAAGTPTPVVKWQVSTDGGVTFNDISGATSATYTFTPTLAQTNYQYRARFSNTVGPVTTTAATLVVSGTITLANDSFSVVRSGSTVVVGGTTGLIGYPADLVTGYDVRNASVTFNTDIGAIVPGTTLTVAADSNVAFATSQHLGSIAVNGRVAMAAGSNIVLRTSNLSIGSTGVLDVADNGLIYDAANGVAATNAVRGLIASARDGGSWRGSGLTSSSAKAYNKYTLGLMTAGEFRSTNGTNALFAGEALGDNSVIVKYVLSGDSDFNGKVDFNDFLRLQNNFGGTGKTTAGGDFDADGDVDFNDFLQLQNNFGQTYTAPPAAKTIVKRIR